MPTAIGPLQLRSASAHCDLALAGEEKEEEEEEEKEEKSSDKI